MSDEDKKLIIKVDKDQDDWLEDLPRLLVQEEGNNESVVYGKSSLNRLSIGILDLNVIEGIQKQPDDGWGFIPRVYGEGCLSSTTLGRRFSGDTIGNFGGERTDRIDVEIFCEPFDPTEEERKEDIKERGIDTSKHDYITLGSDGSNFYLSVHLRNQERFDELLRRVGNGEISSLGIIIDNLSKVSGLYRPLYDYYPEVDYRSGQNFYLLKDQSEISNITDEELDSIPNKMDIESYDFQLTQKFSIVDFTIMFNPEWVTPELFGEEDEEEFNDIEEDIEEEYENPFVPKVPSSDEHIAEQTLVLNRIFKVLTVIAFVIILWVLLEI